MLESTHIHCEQCGGCIGTLEHHVLDPADRPGVLLRSGPGLHPFAVENLSMNRAWRSDLAESGLRSSDLAGVHPYHAA